MDLCVFYAIAQRQLVPIVAECIALGKFKQRKTFLMSFLAFASRKASLSLPHQLDTRFSRHLCHPSRTKDEAHNDVFFTNRVVSTEVEWKAFKSEWLAVMGKARVRLFDRTPPWQLLPHM